MAKQSPSPGPSPVDFMLDNQEVIMRAHQESGGKHKKTWTLLEQALPATAKSMSFSTFKQYLPVFLAVSEKMSRKLGRIRQECTELTDEQARLKVLINDLESKLDQARQEQKGLIGELAESTTLIEAQKREIEKLEEQVPETGGQEEPAVPEQPKIMRILGWTVEYACGCLHARTTISGKSYSLSASRSSQSSDV